MHQVHTAIALFHFLLTAGVAFVLVDLVNTRRQSRGARGVGGSVVKARRRIDWGVSALAAIVIVLAAIGFFVALLDDAVIGLGIGFVIAVPIAYLTARARGRTGRRRLVTAMAALAVPTVVATAGLVAGVLGLEVPAVTAATATWSGPESTGRPTAPTPVARPTSGTVGSAPAAPTQTAPGTSAASPTAVATATALALPTPVATASVPVMPTPGASWTEPAPVTTSFGTTFDVGPNWDHVEQASGSVYEVTLPLCPVRAAKRLLKVRALPSPPWRVAYGAATGYQYWVTSLTSLETDTRAASARTGVVDAADLGACGDGPGSTASEYGVHVGRHQLVTTVGGREWPIWKGTCVGVVIPVLRVHADGDQDAPAVGWLIHGRKPSETAIVAGAELTNWPCKR